MNAADFEELVSMAIEMLEAGRFDEGYDALSDNAQRERINNILVSTLCFKNTKTMYSCNLRGLVEVDKAEFLRSHFISANNHQAAFDALIVALAEELDKGTHLHPIAAQWLASVLRGEKKRPSKRGRPSTVFRDIEICLTIEAIATHTNYATRGDDTSSLSAIDVVQEALGRSGIASITTAHIKDIWEKFQRKRRTIEFPDA